MRRALLAAVVVLTGCSTGSTTSTPPQPAAPVVTPVITAEAAPQAVQKPLPRPGPTIEWYGTIYSVVYSDCAQKLWDDRVKRWNGMTDAERERLIDSDHWFGSQGWPTTHEATLLAPATRKTCPR
jgi:hypothetical protein